MNIELTTYNEEAVEYELTSIDGKTYGIHDYLDNKQRIKDTLVVDMETLDEVEDSELFKEILRTRAEYNFHNPIKNLFN
jgi:hypothetical protein